MISENAERLFTIPEQLILDVENYLKKKNSVFQTPKAKVTIFINLSSKLVYSDIPNKVGLMKGSSEKFDKGIESLPQTLIFLDKGKGIFEFVAKTHFLLK